MSIVPDTTQLKAFSSTIPGLQFAWDSVSLGELKTCPRKYYYTIIEGWQPILRSDHLTFGIHYHRALELYDHRKAEGQSHNDALDCAVKYCLEETVVRLPGDRWRPWTSQEPNKNRETLLRTVVWYLDQFEQDAAQTIILQNSKPAVELSFRFEIDYQIDSQPALLCGHLDRIVEFTGKKFVLDHKTTKYNIDDRYFAQFNPDNQMSLYSLAAQIVYGEPVRGIIIDAAQVLVNSSRFLRGFTFRHKSETDEWLSEVNYWLAQAQHFAQSGVWPKNDKSCGFYGGCPFREVCASAPSFRETLLNASFRRRVWDPLIPRGTDV